MDALDIEKWRFVSDRFDHSVETENNKLSSLLMSCFLVAAIYLFFKCFHCFGFEQPGDIGCSELNSDGSSDAWKSSFRVSSFLLIKLIQEKSEREDRYQATSTNNLTFVYWIYIFFRGKC